MANVESIKNLVEIIGQRETAEVIQLSKRQDRLESYWRQMMRDAIGVSTDKIVANARDTGRLKFELFDVTDVLMRQAYDVMKEGIESTDVRTPVRAQRLASPPPGSVPRTLKSLRRWWDHYRKQGRVPPRQRLMAKKIKDEYIKKVQEVWRRHSDDFLSGNTASVTEAVEAIKTGAGVAYSRAKMIVETETTYYFNKARRQIYDESDDVTHYLFVAIRDHATTKWCKSRHGLVYAKGDPILDKETPPIHWNCRSEVLPLLKHVQAHLRLIEDKARRRRNNQCEPLPVGWTGHGK